MLSELALEVLKDVQFTRPYCFSKTQKYLKVGNILLLRIFGEKVCVLTLAVSTRSQDICMYLCMHACMYVELHVVCFCNVRVYTHGGNKTAGVRYKISQGYSKPCSYKN